MTDRLTFAVAAAAVGTIIFAAYAWRDLSDAIDATFAEPFGDVPNTNHAQPIASTGAQQHGD
jgi:hypothetical protein